jgi:hypothetical protein
MQRTNIIDLTAAAADDDVRRPIGRVLYTIELGSDDDEEDVKTTGVANASPNSHREPSQLELLGDRVIQPSKVRLGTSFQCDVPLSALPIEERTLHELHHPDLSVRVESVDGTMSHSGTPIKLKKKALKPKKKTASNPSSSHTVPLHNTISSSSSTRRIKQARESSNGASSSEALPPIQAPNVTTKKMEYLTDWYHSVSDFLELPESALLHRVCSANTYL